MCRRGLCVEAVGVGPWGVWGCVRGGSCAGEQCVGGAAGS